MRKSSITIFLVFCSIILFAQKQNLKNVQIYLDSLYVQDRLMGSLSIFEGGRSVYNYSVGYRDVETKELNTVETKYRIGSISKTFTAILVMKAVEEGKISLDDTLSKYFPTIKNASLISIRNLLQHRSGIFNITNDPKYLTYYTQPISGDEWIQKISEKISVFQPGTKYQYSNSNYILLSLILEKLYGKQFGEILNDKVVKPYELVGEIYLMKHTSVKENESYSYKWNPDSIWKKENETAASIPLGAGAISAKPKGLNKIMWLLMNGKVVGASSLKEMQELKDGVGLGMFVDTIDQKVYWGHGGSIDGFRSKYMVNLESGIAISLSLNATTENIDKLLEDIVKIYKGEEVPNPINTRKVKAEWDLGRYNGVYKSSSIPLEISLMLKNGYLIGQATGQPSFLLSVVNSLEFENKQFGVKLILNVNGDGFELHQGGLKFKYERKKD